MAGPPEGRTDMDELVDTVQLAPRDEADRLWKAAREAFAHGSESFVKLTEALDLGIRAAELYALLKLRPARHSYPATITALLEESPPEIHVDRDAIHVPRALEFLDILDMLSDEGLPCISRKLHRGWEDPWYSCMRSRETSQKAVQGALDQPARDQLLLLLACRNRIFRLPPPVAIPVTKVMEAVPTLERLVESLRSE